VRRWLQELRARVHQVLRAHLTPEAIGKAVAVGVAIGLLPIYGLHIFACVAAAKWLKLNQALVYAAANISFPVVAPLIVATEIALGEWIRKGTFTPGKALPDGTLWDMVTSGGDLFLSCVLGSVVMGAILAPTLGWLATKAARRWRRPPPPDAVSPEAAEGG
jgi:uncharacterized protein (DUF2062 family)